MNNLWIVMPVYNEEASITTVLNEWVNELEKYRINYTFCILDDGSKDNSVAKIKTLQQENNRIILIEKENSGHGQTCLMGYKYAITHNAEWILQIDSDGQCAASFLPEFIKKANNNSCAFGNRVQRDDGIARKLISKFVSMFTYFATGIWVKDANVPYRLIPSKLLAEIVPIVPNNFHLVNVVVSVLCKKKSRIIWIPIHFRQRIGGDASVKTFSFVKHGLKLFIQLKRFSNLKFSELPS
jgi:dolichol-phosphate mannosyltransferase